MKIGIKRARERESSEVVSLPWHIFVRSEGGRASESKERIKEKKRLRGRG